jgi:hypothetical protein
VGQIPAIVLLIPSLSFSPIHLLSVHTLAPQLLLDLLFAWVRFLELDACSPFCLLFAHESGSF